MPCSRPSFCGRKSSSFVTSNHIVRSLTIGLRQGFSSRILPIKLDLLAGDRVLEVASRARDQWDFPPLRWDLLLFLNRRGSTSISSHSTRVCRSACSSVLAPCVRFHLWGTLGIYRLLVSSSCGLTAIVPLGMIGISLKSSIIRLMSLVHPK